MGGGGGVVTGGGGGRGVGGGGGVYPAVSPQPLHTCGLPFLFIPLWTSH